MDARRWPVREQRLQLYTCYCESSKSLEGDCGMDRVPLCRLTPFQEGTHHKLLAREKNINFARGR